MVPRSTSRTATSPGVAEPSFAVFPLRLPSEALAGYAAALGSPDADHALERLVRLAAAQAGPESGFWVVRRRPVAAALFTADAFYVLAALPFAALVFLTAFELLVAVLQAFVFTILAAVYIGGSMHPEH